jgi:Sec-independent protein translocase protein TatA
MDLSNFGHEQLQQGTLNDMLQEVGIDDVGSFVQEFREEANRDAVSAAQQHGDDEEDEEDEDSSLRTASSQRANLFSMGSSLLNQVFK